LEFEALTLLSAFLFGPFPTRALVRLVFEPLSRRIIRQDVDMLGAQYANVDRFGGPLFTSTRADLLGRLIVDWRRARAEGTAPPAAGEVHDVVIRI
jgi:hypothetical protein